MATAVKFVFAIFVLFIAGIGYLVYLGATVPPRLVIGDQNRQIPLHPDAALRFFVLGDSGFGNEDQMRVGQAMEMRCQEAPLHGILHVGDIFYYEGVADSKDEQWQTKYETPYGGDCLKHVPIFPVLGNHDYRQNPKALIERTEIDSRWMMPARFFSVTFGNLAKIIAIDTIFPDVCFNADKCSLDYLDRELKNNELPWKIAFGHHPLDNSGTKYGPLNPLMSHFLGRALCEEADFYLAGHAHHLEYLRLPGCKTHFVVSGGGGADLGGIKFKGLSEYLAARHGFFELTFTAEKAEIRVFSDQSKELFWKEVYRSNE
jgi:hypothetical protein